MAYRILPFSPIGKILSSSVPTLNTIFLGVMIGGAVLILSLLYLIYDAQVFGPHTNTKTDLMIVSITFTIIHVILTGALLYVTKKMRYARALIQKEKEEIAKIDKAKDEFAAMIAHELKNPMVPIQSYSTMLLDGRFGQLSDIQKEKMKIIISGADSMLFLIQDMLDMHKAELGKMQLNLQPTDLCEIVEGTVTKTQPLAEKRDVTIYNDVDKCVKIIADKHRIEQVLVNLVKNAVDFVPKGTGMIRITASIKESDMIVSVSDNGCGIPKDKVDQLFRKFYQISTSQSRERSSNGLGLAICKNIIELHGGKIWAESEEGKGTTILFKLPLKTETKKKSMLEKIL